MKKHLIIACAAIALFTMASCSEEDMPQGQVGGDFVTFKVGVPQISTRAISDGYTANRLYWGVYDHEGLLLPEISNTDNDSKEDMPFSGSGEVKLTLAQDKDYSIVFWAANESNSMCHVDWDGRCLSVEPKEANQESYDAFCAYVEIKNVSGYKTQEVKLYRPFAQLNIGTADYAKAAASGLAVMNTKIEVSGLPEKYNFVDGSTEGNNTMVYAYPESPVSFKDETFPVNGYEYLAMNYMLVGNDKELVTVKLSYRDDDDQEHERTYTSVPVQRNWRTNIYGNILTSDADFTVMIEPEFEGDNQYEHLSIAKAQDLATALTSNKENIAVALTSDIELPISSLGQQTGGSGEYKLGGENTKNISIDLNGHKLTFTTTYWSVIGAKNADATITIKDGTVTSSQATGTWNSYDMAFANCNYIIEGVTFEKAVAFENEGKDVSLKNVTINETHDYYAMWITAEGQTVNIDGLTIKSAGRGIKIDQQYVDAPDKVTLNIANAKFATAKKAAILVGSEAGANITLQNINLADVQADGFNAVWVDEDYKNFADKVTVNGGSVVVEGTVATVATAEALQTALANNEVKDIYLAAGTTFEGKFYIEAEKELISDAGNQATIKGRVWIKSTSATFKNVTFDRNETHSNEANETASNALQYRAVVMIYGDQTNTIKFEECDFLNNRGTHKSAITNVACDLIIDNCYFEGTSSGIYSQANLSITNSTFNYTGGNNVIASINGCGDNGGKFIFKNNTITNKIFALSQFLSTVGFGNGTYHFDVQGNTGAGFDHYFLNGTRVANKTFAEGSETF